MKHKHISKLALVAALWFFSCTSVERDNPYDSGGINYIGDSNIDDYGTVKIGDQVWMAKNMSYPVKGSKCYNNSETNCERYGRLYNWAAAMALPDSCKNVSCESLISAEHRGICPEGWHIPSGEDWEKLMDYVEDGTGDPFYRTAYKFLKAKSGWKEEEGNGEDKYGFSALPSGFGDLDGIFHDVGNYAVWWSADSWDNDAGHSTIGWYSANSDGYSNPYDKLYLYSVRCIKSNSATGVSSSSTPISSSSGVAVGPSGCDVERIDTHGSGCDISGYKTVVIGTQTWMAENLNCDVGGSKCYDNSAANCNKYGRLYDWETAMSVCPSGWHLPSDEEWEYLIDFVGGWVGNWNTADRYLKAKGGWCNNGNGEDTYGFSALPGGRYYDGDFGTIGKSGYWWSSEERYGDGHHFKAIYYSNVGMSDFSGGDKADLYSVRCVQN